MDKFCKLFEFDDVGQVLVLNDTSEDGNPSVSVKFKPDGMGLCGPESSWTNTKKGWDQCDKHFESITRERAYIIAKEIIDALKG